jgi:diadenylate cyclase
MEVAAPPGFPAAPALLGPALLAQVRIGFVPLGWLDVLDIVLVAYLIYRVYLFIRGTVAVQVALVVLAIYLFDVVVRAAGLVTLGALFDAISDVFVIAIVVLFAPEIRRFLFLLGRNPLVRRFVTPAAPRARITAEVAAAIAEMSENRVGSLIAFARSTSLRSYIESGTRIHADVERDLLASIFFPNSPLHDGGVVIQGQKIEAARCIFPVSEARTLDPHLGLRHRAAIGLTERTDAFVIITSEETGRISVAENGRLDYGLSIAEVEARLAAAFAPDAARPRAED